MTSESNTPEEPTGLVTRDTLRSAARGGLEANFLRYLKFCGIGDDEVVELFSLAGKRRDEDRRRDVNRVAYGRGHSEIIRLVGEGGGWQQPKGLFILPSKIIPDLAARIGLNEWAQADGRAQDKHVTERSVVLIDFDPKREPSDISATKKERDAAWRVSLRGLLHLAAALGGYESLGWGASGNGGQVHLATAVENEPEADAVVNDLLLVMSVIFDGDEDGVHIEVDQSVGNAARLVPAFGSMKRKGANTKERPWRNTFFICGDGDPQRLDLDALKNLVTRLKEGLTSEQQARLAEGQNPKEKTGAKGKSQSSFAGCERPLDACNKANVADVYARLGGDPERPVCPHPSCSATEGIDCLVDKGMNIIKCQHDSCGAQPWNPVSLVAMMEFGAEKLTGDKDTVKKVVAWFKDQGLVDLPTGTKKKRLSKLEQVATLEAVAAENDFDTYHPTDEGNARRLVARYGNRIRYVPRWGRWLVYNGTHWAHDDDEVGLCNLGRNVIDALHQQAKLVGDKDKEAGDALKAWALSSESARARHNMITLARSIPAVVVADPKLIDADPWLLNLKNGTLDLRSGELRAHDPADLIDRVAPVEWQGFDAPAPTWDRFLERVQLDAGIRAYLYRRWGYGLTGVIREHLFALDLGPGANGKGTAHNTVIKILGPYAATVPMSLLAKKRADAHPVDRMTLFRVRYAVAAEPEEGMTLDTALVKTLTGGDNVKGRGMGENFVEFEPTWTICVHANFAPKVSALDPAIWRRVQLVPWSVVIPEEEQEQDLHERLQAEAPGILARLVRGCLEWQKSGLAPPEPIRLATAKYRQDEDIIGEWIDDNCIVEEGAAVTWASLWERYQKSAGKFALSKKRFRAALDAKGIFSEKRGKNHVTYRVGLRLRSMDVFGTDLDDELEATVQRAYERGWGETDEIDYDAI